MTAQTRGTRHCRSVALGRTKVLCASRTASFRSRQVGHAEPATSAVNAPISHNTVLAAEAPADLGSLLKNSIFFCDALTNSTAASNSEPLSRLPMSWWPMSAVGLTAVGASQASFPAVVFRSGLRRFPRYLCRVLYFRTSELHFFGLVISRKRGENTENCC